jgi:hypothetical protein
MITILKNTIHPANTNILNDKSYYLTGKPYFWNVNSAWPSIGGSNVLSSGTIPAKERYLSNQNKTICLERLRQLYRLLLLLIVFSVTAAFSKITVSAIGGSQPYKGTGEYYKPGGNYTFVVSDAFGYNDSGKIMLGEPESNHR